METRKSYLIMYKVWHYRSTPCILCTTTSCTTLVLVHILYILYIQGVLRASVASLSGSMLGRVAREGLQVARGLRALCGQRQSLWIVPYQRGALKPHLRHLSGTLDFIIIPFARGTRRTRDLAGYFYSYMCRCRVSPVAVHALGPRGERGMDTL